ncbi:MAG TPA: hypothetical protein VK694_02105 [Verrucomicrobiae bacterium]|nr:hypothetical protein [Verrucomicrobiae bacterium]
MKKTPEAFSKPTALHLQSIAAFALAYILGSRAIDTGSWWQYLGCVMLLVVGIKLGIRSFRTYGKKR